MNKLFIVILAVCLISVHGFVKRDAPATDDKGHSVDFNKLLDEGQKMLTSIQDTVGQQFEEIKTKAEKAINDIKASIDASGQNKGPAAGA